MSTESANNTYTFKAEDAGQRLDKALLHMFPQLNFTAVNKLCRKGQIRLDGKRVKGNERIETGQVVKFPPVLAQQTEEGAEEGRENAIILTPAERKWLKGLILFQDEHLLIINKPAGVPVQAGSGHTRSLDRLMVELIEDAKPRLVHRLDKATTGTLVFALSRKAAAAMAYQFADRTTDKIYIAVVQGMPLESEGIIDFALKKTAVAETGNERVRAVKNNKEGLTGDEASTAYKRLARKGSMQLLEAKPLTGRTHQIRAHFSIMGAPIYGDVKYGGDAFKHENKARMFLHAHRLSFEHPETGKLMTITAPLPDYFDMFVDQQGWVGKF